MTVVTVFSEAVTDVDTADTATVDTTVDAPGVDTTAAATRHARALAALRSAEVRTGVRRQATSTPVVQAVRPGQLGEQAAREQPRSMTAPTAEPTTETPVVPAAQPTVRRSAPGSRAGSGAPGDEARVLPVDPRLADLLPDGGLRTGTTVVVQGSTSLLLTLLAEASRDGAWTVLVGYPAAGMAAAADAGCDLSRTLVVPLPTGSGVDAPAVLAALIDGMDVVVVGPEVELPDQDRRRLTARARDRETVLVAALPTPALSAGSSPLQRSSAGREASTQREGWGGAHVVLEAVGGVWGGIDQGTGWLRRRTLRVRRTGRGSAARPLHLDVEVPVCRAADGGVELSGGQGFVGEAGTAGESSESRPQLELVG